MATKSSLAPPSGAAGALRTPDSAWDSRQLSELAQELAQLSVRELTRTSAPVREPRFIRNVEALLKRGFEPRQLADMVKLVAENSLHLSHPRYMAQQVAAPVPAAALVDGVVSALNQSLAVWRMSPAGTMLDRSLAQRFKKLFGLPRTAEGTFVPGGSFANLTGLLAARAGLDPKAWTRGGANIAVLCGEQTHYSIGRAAGIMGLGTASVFPIPIDKARRTDAGAVAGVVKKARKAGYRKFILVGTSGSTPTASFDDLVALGAAARQAGAWFHVDAAHGGGFLFSPRYKRLMRGVARADSIAFDPHKMMFMPLSAGYVLVRDGALLHRTFEQDAPYLFSAVERDYPDVGRFTIACSQRFEALKVWMALGAYGEGFFGELVEGVCAAAHAAYEYCLQSQVLEPVHEPAANIFCFRLRQRPKNAAASSRLHFALEEAVNGSGEGYISSTVIDGERTLRIVVMNPRSTAKHVLANLKLVERLAREEARSRLLSRPLALLSVGSLARSPVRP